MPKSDRFLHVKGTVGGMSTLYEAVPAANVGGSVGPPQMPTAIQASLFQGVIAPTSFAAANQISTPVPASNLGSHAHANVAIQNLDAQIQTLVDGILIREAPVHAHLQEHVTDVQSALDAKANLANVSQLIATKAPAVVPFESVIGLQDKLLSKMDARSPQLQSTPSISYSANTLFTQGNALSTTALTADWGGLQPFRAIQATASLASVPQTVTSGMLELQLYSAAETANGGTCRTTVDVAWFRDPPMPPIPRRNLFSDICFTAGYNAALSANVAATSTATAAEANGAIADKNQLIFNVGQAPIKPISLIVRTPQYLGPRPLLTCSALAANSCFVLAENTTAQCGITRAQWAASTELEGPVYQYEFETNATAANVDPGTLSGQYCAYLPPPPTNPPANGAEYFTVTTTGGPDIDQVAATIHSEAFTGNGAARLLVDASANIANGNALSLRIRARNPASNLARVALIAAAACRANTRLFDPATPEASNLSNLSVTWTGAI